MRLSPQPRYRYYATAKIYPALIKRSLFGRHGRDGPDEIASLAERIADLTGTTHALCLPQARVGLYLALRCLIRPGQNVILSPYNLYDVINMVICAGGRPVFADVEPDSFHIDPNAIESLIDDDTGAVIATHLHGLICDIEKITEICRAKGIAVIEDAAQCFGGRIADRYVGTFGDVGVFSFSHAKNINTLFGGMAVIRDDAVHDYFVEALAAFAPESLSRLLRRAALCFAGDVFTMPVVFQLLTFPLLRYDYLHDGKITNWLVQAEDRPVMRQNLPEQCRCRMTPIQAGLAMKQLDELESQRKQRAAYARMYHQGLSDLPDLNFPTAHEDHSNVYLAFPIQVPDRRRVVDYMMRHRRDLRVSYFDNLADDPCFEQFAADCPNARKVAERVLLLPTYPSYGKAEVEKNIDALRSCFGRERKFASCPSPRT